MQNITQTPKNVKEQTIRVGVYERVSTEEQAEHGVSLNAQAEHLEHIAKIEGWQIYDHYREEGITGGTDNRPQLQRLLADARAGRIDLVVCSTVSRLFRNTRLLLNYIHELESYGVGFVAQAEGIDTSKPGMSKIMLSLLGSIAEMEKEQIGQRIRAFRRHLAGKGQWSSGQTPFGYRFNKEHKILEIEETEAKIIRFAYSNYVKNGISISALAETMNIENMIPPRAWRKGNAHWTHPGVRRILIHPGYKGGPNEDWCFSTPMIVEPELWERVKRKLASNKSFRPMKAATRPAYQGRLYCSLCGRLLRIGYSHNTQQVYECSGRLKMFHLDGSEKCTLPRFRTDQVDESLDTQLQQIASNPDLLADYLRNTINNYEAEIEGLEQRLKPLNTEVIRIQEDMAILDARVEMRRINTETYLTRMKALKSSLSSVKARQNQTDPWQIHKLETAINLKGDNLRYYQEILGELSSYPEEKRNNFLQRLQDPSYSLGDEYMGWLSYPDSVIKNMIGIVFPNRTVEFKCNIKIGQSSVTPVFTG